MFDTDKLVYLQLQKTGCTHVERMLRELVGGKSVGRKHGRLESTFPLEGRTIVGSVRNPWSWYVSLWAFACTRTGAIYTSTTRRSLAHGPDGGPRFSPRWAAQLWRSLLKPTAKWRRLYADSNDPALFREWLRLVLDPRRAHDLGRDYGRTRLKHFAGLLTYRYLFLYASDVGRLYASDGLRTHDALSEFDRTNNMVNLMIRTESLERDLVAVLKTVGHEVDERAVAALRTTPRTNTSRHRRSGEYYDSETLDLVARREAFIIAKYGYAPPSIARTPASAREASR